jgi:hypothetical protein
MASAPRDGRIVEICDGAKGKIALAFWDGLLQGWVDDDNHSPLRQLLHVAVGWRPVD